MYRKCFGGERAFLREKPEEAPLQRVRVV